MAITVAQSEPKDSPEAFGRQVVEFVQVTGDGATTTVAITPKWLRRVRGVVGGGGNCDHAISTANPNVITLTFQTAPANGKVFFLLMWGEGR